MNIKIIITTRVDEANILMFTVEKPAVLVVTLWKIASSQVTLLYSKSLIIRVPATIKNKVVFKTILEYKLN